MSIKDNIISRIQIFQSIKKGYLYNVTDLYNVIFCRVLSPVPGFRGGVATLNLSHRDIKFFSRDVPENNTQ